jgi:hypothetical protein
VPDRSCTAGLFKSAKTDERNSRATWNHGEHGTHTEREMSRPNWTGAARKEKPRAVELHAAGRKLQYLLKSQAMEN